MTHRASWRVDRCFARSHWVEPSAMCACDVATEVSDRGNQRRPDLGRRIAVRPVIATGVEAQCRSIVQSRNAALAQICFCDRAGNRLCHREQPSCRFGRPDWCRWLGREPVCGWLRRREAEERARLVKHDPQTLQLELHGAEVAAFTMLAGGALGPIAVGALPAVRYCEA